MKSLVFLAVIGLIVAPALASPEIMPVKGQKAITYDMATGRITPGSPNPGRYGDSIWAATQRSGYYYVQMYYGTGTTSLEWGDIDGSPGVGGYSFSYACDSVLLPERMDVVHLFFGEENGWNGAGSTGRTFLAGYRIVNVPTADPGGAFNGWTVWVDIGAAGAAFTISGSDLDGDGLTDFGYTYWFTDYTQNNPLYPYNYVGPTIAGDPNVIPPTAPGMEDAWDEFFDPNLNNFDGTYWFGGNPFAQFYMELFEESNVPQLYCATAGAHGWYCTADIQPWPAHDCIVDLSDLAQLLGNYPTASGAAHEDGDVEPEDNNGNWDPWDGDGDIDLGDLAQLLGMYNDDCN